MIRRAAARGGARRGVAARWQGGVVPFCRDRWSPYVCRRRCSCNEARRRHSVDVAGLQVRRMELVVSRGRLRVTYVCNFRCAAIKRLANRWELLKRSQTCRLRLVTWAARYTHVCRKRFHSQRTTSSGKTSWAIHLAKFQASLAISSHAQLPATRSGWIADRWGPPLRRPARQVSHRRRR